MPIVTPIIKQIRIIVITTNGNENNNNINKKLTIENSNVTSNDSNNFLKLILISFIFKILNYIII